MRKLIFFHLFLCSCAMPPVSQETTLPPENPKFLQDKKYCQGFASQAAKSHEGLSGRQMYEHTLINCLRDKGWDHSREDLISR